jgi:hypothetical protein
MLLNNEELYQAVREIAAALCSSGHPELAKDVEESILVSSLPGEVLGEARLTLQRLHNSEIGRRLDIRKKVNEAIEYINRALDQADR